MTLFELNGVTTRYQEDVVLTDITLRINKGERVALIGKSGVGKSTLLRLLFEHQPHQVSLIPQQLGLVNTLSVYHNVYMGRLARHPGWYNIINLIRPLSGKVSEIMQLIEPLGLADKLHTPVGELSGGQQQRTAISRALYQGNPILLGDEPVSSVDEHQARTVMDTLYNAYETTVLAMHDLELALLYSDRVIGLQDKRITLDAASRDLRAADLKFLYH
jgi:phosphonate transport system ATP-binding protein